MSKPTFQEFYEFVKENKHKRGSAFRKMYNQFDVPETHRERFANAFRLVKRAIEDAGGIGKRTESQGKEERVQ